MSFGFRFPNYLGSIKSLAISHQTNNEQTQNETRQTHQSLGTIVVSCSKPGMESENFFYSIVIAILFHVSSLWNESLPQVHCCLNSALYPYGLIPNRSTESVGLNERMIFLIFMQFQLICKRPFSVHPGGHNNERMMKQSASSLALGNFPDKNYHFWEIIQ